VGADYWTSDAADAIALIDELDHTSVNAER
jgi:hypothetical protein